MSERLLITVTELEDMGSESRDAKVFGVTAEGTVYTFEVPAPHYPTAILFFVIGMMEGLRLLGRSHAFVTETGTMIVGEADGSITLRREDDTVIDTFNTWPEAFMAATG